MTGPFYGARRKQLRVTRSRAAYLGRKFEHPLPAGPAKLARQSLQNCCSPAHS